MDREKLEKSLKLALPPVLTAVFMLVIFAFNGMYPFGDVSIAWSDGFGQFIPLLAEFKDVLDGQSSFFFNFQISGGSNFYGIYLYYLVSPFTFLVKFVNKENLPGFFNILILLKMVTIAFSAAYCFTTLRKKLELFWVVLFSLTYAFCGYVMMYYLILSWPDMLYVFPLLIVGLERIVKERRPLMYIVVLAVSCLLNYYITYMFGIFILLFMGVYLVLNYKERDCSAVCRQILLGSLLAFLVTAIFWLPSFMQYKYSARGEKTIVQTIASKKLFFHRYETSLPLLMAQSLPLVLVLADLIKRRKRSKENNLYLILLGLTVVPFILEPINLLWHTGNYMCFPCRFSFITIFLALLCSAYVLEETDTEPKLTASKLVAYGNGVLGIVLLGCASWFVFTILNENVSKICKYVVTLWGDFQSIKYLSYIFVTIFILYSAVYWAYCRRYISKSLLFIFLSCIFLVESLVNIDIYFVHCAEIHKFSNQRKIAAYDLCGKIEDNDFYRVKSRGLFHSDNCVGSLGYNSISSYTSLNNYNYMKTMKALGYSGSWMGISSYGGTELTDSLLSIKYEINGNGKQEIYKSPAGSINRLAFSLPMGLYLGRGSLDKAEFLPSNSERSGVQRFISKYILGEDIVKKYRPQKKIKKTKGFYNIKSGTVINYKIKVKEERSFYLDIYDRFSISLGNPLFEAAEVKINGKKLKDRYPGKKNNNGLLYLGTYKNETLKICLHFKRSVKCRSFGIFSLDVGKLQEFCAKAQGADLKIKGDGLYTKCNTPEDCSLFVSLPYSDNFAVKVNGERVDYKRAFSDFIVFDLPKGENEISIIFVPEGLVCGAVISCLGVILSVLYVKFASKLEEKIGNDKVTKIIAGAISSAVVLGVYIVPVLIKVFY